MEDSAERQIASQLTNSLQFPPVCSLIARTDIYCVVLCVSYFRIPNIFILPPNPNPTFILYSSIRTVFTDLQQQ